MLIHGMCRKYRLWTTCSTKQRSSTSVFLHGMTSQDTAPVSQMYSMVRNVKTARIRCTQISQRMVLGATAKVQVPAYPRIPQRICQPIPQRICQPHSAVHLEVEYELQP